MRLAVMVEELDVLLTQLMVGAQAMESPPQRFLHQRQARSRLASLAHVEPPVDGEDAVEGVKVLAVDAERVEREGVADPGHVARVPRALGKHIREKIKGPRQCLQRRLGLEG